MLLVSELLVLPVPILIASLVNGVMVMIYAQSSRQESIVQRVMRLWVTVLPNRLPPRGPLHRPTVPTSDSHVLLLEESAAQVPTA